MAAQEKGAGLVAGELIRTNKVTVSFGGLIALKDVDFSVSSGEIVGLIGPNGSGKSTLFNVLNGLNRPTRGDIFFEGKPVTGVKPHVLSRLGVGRTFQALRLLNSETVLNCSSPGLLDTELRLYN